MTYVGWSSFAKYRALHRKRYIIHRSTSIKEGRAQQERPRNMAGNGNIEEVALKFQQPIN